MTTALTQSQVEELLGTTTFPALTKEGLALLRKRIAATIPGIIHDMVDELLENKELEAPNGYALDINLEVNNVE